MPSFHPITPARHATKRLRAPAGDYRFAATQSHARLLAHELSVVLTNQPIAFLRAGDVFVPAAILSLHDGRNLYVAPDGRWLAGYVPEVFRNHPFALGEQADGQQVLCVDEESALLSDTEGDALFEADGSQAPLLRAVVERLQRFVANEQATARACAALARHRLIVPWALQVHTEGVAAPETVQGLYRVDEVALDALSDEAFLELRRTGALPVAWCQLLSMRHVSLLRTLAERHTQIARAAGATPAPAAASLDFLSRDGTIDLGKL